MSADHLLPYRIEARHSSAFKWIIVDEAEAHDEALEIAEAFPKAHEGYRTRVVVQHVIERRP